MKYNDVKINYYYFYRDVDNEKYLIYIVGKDRFTGKWVATSQVWAGGVSLLEDDDFERLFAF